MFINGSYVLKHLVLPGLWVFVGFFILFAIGGIYRRVQLNSKGSIEGAESALNKPQ